MQEASHDPFFVDDIGCLIKDDPKSRDGSGNFESGGGGGCSATPPMHRNLTFKK